MAIGCRLPAVTNHRTGEVSRKKPDANARALWGYRSPLHLHQPANRLTRCVDIPEEWLTNCNMEQDEFPRKMSTRKHPRRSKTQGRPDYRGCEANRPRNRANAGWPRREHHSPFQSLRRRSPAACRGIRTAGCEGVDNPG